MKIKKGKQIKMMTVKNVKYASFSGLNENKKKK